MKTTPRPHIKAHSLHEVIMPYSLSINYYGPTTRYKDNSGKELKTPVIEHAHGVHITIFDDAQRYAGRDRFKTRREKIDDEFSNLRSVLTIDVYEEGDQLSLERCIDMFSYKLEQISDQETEGRDSDNE